MFLASHSSNMSNVSKFEKHWIFFTCTKFWGGGGLKTPEIIQTDDQRFCFGQADSLSYWLT